MSTSPSLSLAKRSKPSTSLVKAAASEPPVKRIKRPEEVLEEEEYEAGLDHIIRRDFFPGLAETDAKREYLAAVESKDPGWIFEAGQALRATQKPLGSRKRAAGDVTKTPGTPASRLRATAGDTPRTWEEGDTPRTAPAWTPTAQLKQEMSEAASSKANLNLCLSEFQHRYTSEDNESFYKLLDKSNATRAKKHAYLWSGGNKLATNRQIEEARRKQVTVDAQAQEDAVNGRVIALLETKDHRPAAPEGWQAKPDNSFMFIPEGVEDTHGSEYQRAVDRSRMGPKSIVVENTRMAPPPPRPRHRDSNEHVPESPSLSAVRAAVRGDPRISASMAGSVADGVGDSTPRVNGWAFVDSEEPEPEHSTKRRRGFHGSEEGDDDNDDDDDDSEAEIDLGPGDATPNPFRVRASGRREALHDKMLERMNRAKINKRLDSVRTPVARFAGSPRIAKEGMSPAAKRLLGKVSVGGAPGVQPSSSSKEMFSGGGGFGGLGGRRDSTSLGEGWASVTGTPRRGKVGLAGVTPVKKKP